MNNYYTSIELGSDTIKILVCNKVDNDFHLIASVSSPSAGIKRGQIVDGRKAVNAIKKAIKKINDMLGIKIGKAIACIPTNDCHMDIVFGEVEIEDHQEITGKDVSMVIKDALDGKVTTNQEVVTVMPISFKVDQKDGIKDPKGLQGNVLGIKALITTSPKEYLYEFLQVLKLGGIDVVDVCYTATGDYFEVRNEKIDKTVSAMIDIGETSTSISVYNKGIMIKNKTLNVGSINIDKDLTYIFQTKLSDSRKLKENFVVASSKYADVNEVKPVTLDSGEKRELNQLELSKVVEARLVEILKIAKNELKNLTKREIRYIIVTGGVSELAGFQYITEDVLGIKARVCNITTMGVRHNKYSSTLGSIKYFDQKLALRGKKTNMLKESDITKLISVNQTKETSDNIMNKVFGRFFEN